MDENINPDAQVYLDIAEQFEQEGNYDEAIRVYHTAIELYPGLAILHNNLGCCLANQNLFDEAKQEFLRVIEISENGEQSKD